MLVATSPLILSEPALSGAEGKEGGASAAGSQWRNRLDKRVRVGFSFAQK